jgi:hypothetical protein
MTWCVAVYLGTTGEGENTQRLTVKINVNLDDAGYSVDTALCRLA